MDGLETKLTGQAEVIRLDVTSDIGRTAATHFGVRGVPTLVVVNGQGEAVLTQVGIIRPWAVQEAISAAMQ